MAQFHNVEFRIALANHHSGRYVVTCDNYKGQPIKTYTNDADIYDWLNDDSDKARHNFARRSAYQMIVSEYLYQLAMGYPSYR